MERDIKAVGLRAVGRPQTTGTLACLYNCRDRWETLVLLGSLDKPSIQIVNELQRTNKVIWDTGKGLSGYQAMRLMYQLQSLEMLNTDKVLFLDDDLIFDNRHVDMWLEENKENELVVIAPVTSQTSPKDIEVMVQIPSFDLLCTLMDARLVNLCPGNYLWLLAEMNDGGEFFLMHWMFKRGYEHEGKRDKKFIKVVDMVSRGGRRPLHIWIPDKHKTWVDLPAQWWEELYSDIQYCHSVEEMRSRLEQRKLLRKQEDE